MTQIIILAGGKGSRLGQSFPKALTPIGDKAIIEYLLDSIKVSEVCSQPCILVGHQSDEIRQTLGSSYKYAYQKEQLGTGHALKCAIEVIDEDVDTVMVLYGDHGFVQADTISKLASHHAQHESPVTLMTVNLENYNDWRNIFYSFGRIIRDERDKVSRIVELKDATDLESSITEVNPSYFCFDMDWLRNNIEKITNQNKKGEYYLTDLIGIAMQQGQNIESISVDNAIEGIGVNTPEELEVANRLIKGDI